MKAGHTIVQTTPNANFISIGGTSVHTSNDPKYLEYRRQWIENPKKFIINQFPVHLDIESTSRCNLRCTFCDKRPWMNKLSQGDMEFDLFKKIIDEGSSNELCSIKLSYRGEPLLHPRIADMVSYARKRDILDIYFNTNGMLLTKSMGQKLIEAGLNRISVSVEGTDSETYEQIRVGAKFSRVLRNIETLIKVRERSRVSYPLVRVQTVRLPGLDMNAYIQFWQPRCDEVAALDYHAPIRNRSLVDENWACPQLWQRMAVEWDGTVLPCNNDDYGFLSPGNVGEKTIQHCWQAPMLQEARQIHRRGKSHLLKSCNGCMWRTTQILKGDLNRL